MRTATGRLLTQAWGPDRVAERVKLGPASMVSARLMSGGHGHGHGLPQVLGPGLGLGRGGSEFYEATAWSEVPADPRTGGGWQRGAGPGDGREMMPGAGGKEG